MIQHNLGCVPIIDIETKTMTGVLSLRDAQVIGRECDKLEVLCNPLGLLHDKICDQAVQNRMLKKGEQVMLLRLCSAIKRENTL
mmetsp:Transcript_37514/g.73843  ORF Transcript_37514/g.73843 Transcript_37514/m.73843 type:complete len:84 (+) Transcript_37514:301-552(+)